MRPLSLKALATALLAALPSLDVAQADGAPDSPLQPMTLEAELAWNVIDVDLLELTSIKWRPGQRLPRRVRALDGETIRVSGYMALDTPEGVEHFRLTWDSCNCSGTKVHHFIKVLLPEGEVTEFNPDEMTLVGKIAVGEEEEDGFTTSVYRLQLEQVE